MFTYIRVPVADMRESPRGDSKIVSQALFGEEVQVGERAGEWGSIATPDSYTGWVFSAHLVALPTVYPTHVEVTRLSAHIYPVPDTEYGPLITLPFGVGLKVIDSSDPRWIKISLIDGQEAYVQKGDVQLEPHVDLVTLSRKFLGLPYTWGGRSSFGYDCSGFVQMLYRRVGIHLPRDARQQIRDPRCKPIPLETLAPGDLLFFGPSEQEIKHVGMCLEGTQFIHTSSRENKPYVRISKLTDTEWSGSGEVSYPFRAARRII
ncbi:MAG TPA: SH3 domain-containing C40 family peptidase [Chlamydiales bacterium]|nr:SH3 domain-containing C40 family peptidase [Chlamydiales bacterium]